MATNVKILLRRGLRNEITADTLDAGELGYAKDTRQLFVGTEPGDSSIPINEIVFDPFSNAQSIVQTFLNQHTAEQRLEIDEDLIIRNVSDVPALLTAMEMYGIITAGSFEPTVTATSGSFVVNTVYTILVPGTTDFTLIGAADSVVGTVFTATGSGTGTGTATYAKEYKIKTVGTTDYTLIGAADNNVGTIFTTTGVGTGTGTAIDTYDHFYANIFASERKNVEVLTENSFSQVYANMHLQSHTATDGRRPDLFKKELNANDTTEGTFLKYAASDSTSFFIDYSLKQTDATNTFVRVGTIRIINGHATTPPLTGLVKLTDDNTEIWQDDGDGTAEADEFSNIVFASEIDNALRIAGFSILVDVKYKIVTINDGLGGADTDFTLIGAADNNVGTVFTATRTDITAGSFEIGESYTIKTVGTTDFTLVGATDSNIGTVFTATGVGTGTGIATNSGTGTGSGTVELAVIPMNITYTQDANFTTEISYTVKRWTM